MKTNGAIITNAGLELISYALANQKEIIFTKTKLGKGDVSSFEEAKKLTDVVSIYKEVPITSVARNNAGVVRIRTTFTNADFQYEVTLKEIGVFATVDGKEETLFAYVNDGDGESFPPGDSGNIVERVRDSYVGVSTSLQVTATIDRSVIYATVFDLEEGLALKENKFDKNGAFNKNFGVASGDVLEGHRMAQSLGVEKFGGDVQTAGTKKVGYAYWCTVNKDMYICKVENSLNYIDASYFEAFSNNALLGKLNNLLAFETVELAYFILPNNGNIIIELKENWTNFIFLKLSMLDNDRKYHIDTVFLPVNSINVGDGFNFSDPGNSPSIETTSLRTNITIRDYKSLNVFYGNYGSESNNNFIVEGICRIV